MKTQILFNQQKPEIEHKQMQRLLAMAQSPAPVKTAVVHPTDYNSLLGAIEATNQNLIEPILIGPEYKIKTLAEQYDVDISPYQLVNTEHSHKAAQQAVELAGQLEVDTIMKGNIATGELMQAIIGKESTIRTERRMSHVFVMDVPSYPKPLLVTDAAINIAPDLITKKDIVQNAIELAQVMEVETPKVAILAAVEKVNPIMPATIDAAALCKMADRHQIKHGILDGPLAFDNAISKEAALAKNIDSPVAGDADILLTPDLEAGNILAKQLHYLANADSAGIVLGAKVPIILTSRSEKPLERLGACAVALLLVQNKGR